MAINYTKTSWANGAPPAVNSTNLNKLETAVKAAADACDSIIEDNGYKYPGANTGQKIASALTSAGYSIAPATGTSSLDNIADGTSYKRIQAAKADAINGGTFDAASVLAFGIGGDVKLLANNFDLNTLGGLGTGIYKVYDATNRPTGINNHAYVIQIKFDTSNCYQEFIAGPTSGGSALKWFRYKESGTWSSWYNVWTSLSDGNVGRPPAAKENRTSNSTIGWFDVVDCASGAQVTLPSGGTFAYEVLTYGTTYNGTKAGIVAGGLMSGTASANLTMRYRRLS